MLVGIIFRQRQSSRDTTYLGMVTSRTKGKSEVEFLISREQVQPGVDDVVAGWSRGGLLATQTVASYKHTQDTQRE